MSGFYSDKRMGRHNLEDVRSGQMRLCGYTTRRTLRSKIHLCVFIFDLSFFKAFFTAFHFVIDPMRGRHGYEDVSPWIDSPLQIVGNQPTSLASVGLICGELGEGGRSSSPGYAIREVFQCVKMLIGDPQQGRLLVDGKWPGAELQSELRNADARPESLIQSANTPQPSMLSPPTPIISPLKMNPGMPSGSWNLTSRLSEVAVDGVVCLWKGPEPTRDLLGREGVENPELSRGDYFLIIMAVIVRGKGERAATPPENGDPPLLGFHPTDGCGSDGSPHWPLVGVSSPVCERLDEKLGSLGGFRGRFPLLEPERSRLDDEAVGGKGGCPLGGGGSGGRLYQTEGVGVGVFVGGVPFYLLGNGSGGTETPDCRPGSCLDLSVRADSGPSRTSRGRPSFRHLRSGQMFQSLPTSSWGYGSHPTFTPPRRLPSLQLQGRTPRSSPETEGADWADVRHVISRITTMLKPSFSGDWG
ncbi:hypothetical protein BJ322DRAFT_1170135 [Thelephora terrestris]|uniref:Uncharacterized protein n=1 Tax=Thelephora terrestris TaxID=56493 RepID=A0A9P6HN15_9AGAM|nr:hypothetical protein BJ322DRAFT_1170135 [Thelephora terrestris]